MVILALVAAVMGAAAEVRTAPIPGGGIAPEAVVDAKGVVHLAYGRDGNAYYIRSADNGRTFSAPLRINTADGVVSVGHERGPKLSLGRSGVVHVAWIGTKGQGAWYTRLEGGKFLPERNLNDAGSAVDGTTVAADARGRVFVFWLDSRLPEDPKSPVAQAIFYARSDDNGKTFGDNRQVKSEYPGRACACCTLAAETDAAGVIRLAFRGGYEALRNIELVESRDGQSFKWHEVHNDGWKIVGCPMSGADLKVTKGVPAVAWMSQGDIFYRIGDGPRLGPGAPKKVARNFPLLLFNSAGERLLAWTEGMELRWELTSAGGVVRTGAEKSLTHASRPGGFTGLDGNFYLIP